jgi:penicillin-binding protein 2
MIVDESTSFDKEPQTRKTVKVFGDNNPRIKIFYYIYTAILLYLITFLAKTQLFDKDLYDEKNEQQSLRRILYPGPRGDIYDRNGRLLVGTRPKFSAVIYLNDVKIRKDIKNVYYAKVRERRKNNEIADLEDLSIQARKEVLQSYLKDANRIINKENAVDIKKLERHYYQTPILPFTLIEELTPEEYALLTEKLPVNHPIQIYTDSARFYPFHSAASHILGYVTRTTDIPIGELPGEGLKTFNLTGKIGQTGLEKSMERVLGGKTGSTVWVVDHAGYQYEKKEEEQVNPVRGGSVTITIDIDLQKAAEHALGNYTGAVVVLEVDSGDVLAIASKPDYDLNDLSPYISNEAYEDIEKRGAWLNRAIQGQYPPASTFKLITAIAAMRNNTLDPLKEIECPSSYTVGTRVFNEHDMFSFGMVDLPKALQKSSNVYFYQVALNTGVDIIANEAQRFGLGQLTGIELPAEHEGLVPTPKWKKQKLYEQWVAGDTVNMAIGQGYVITTPLQMACFTASLARKQTRTIPTIIYDADRKYTFNHKGQSIGLTDHQYEQLIKGMKLVAKTGGTAKVLDIPGLTVAAKTGTAQFRDKGKQIPLAWTIAFAPVEHPKIAIAVMIEGVNVEDNYHGGSTAGPIAREIFEYYFQKKSQVTAINLEH